MSSGIARPDLGLLVGEPVDHDDYQIFFSNRSLMGLRIIPLYYFAYLLFSVLVKSYHESYHL